MCSLEAGYQTGGQSWHTETMPSLEPTSGAHRSSPKRLLVLGGSSEIAIATVNAMSDRGLGSVTLAGRDNSRLEAAKSQVRLPGQDVHLVSFDATDTDGFAAFFATVNRSHGPFDAALVAFGDLGEPFGLDTDPAQAAALMDLNGAAATAATLGAGQMLCANGGGSLVVISSIAAVRARPANLAYGASKSGLDAFCRGFRDVLHHSEVKLSVVRPGFVHTRMTEGLDPAPFATTPEAVGADIADGVDAGSAIIWSPGILRWASPILNHLPGPIWRKLSNR